MRRASLRSMMALVTLVITLLALVVAGSLVVLTEALHNAASSSTAAVESVRLAEEAEIDLLLLERTREPIVKRSIEGDLRSKLSEARQFVTTEEEARILARAVAHVDEYITSATDPGATAAQVTARQGAAYAALESFVSMNVQQAKLSQRDAQRWGRIGHALGIGVGAILILVSGGVIVWLRGRAFEPIIALAEAMERFGRGERDVRAAEQGTRELCEMSRRFNEMASAVAAQREAQMAFLGSVAHDLRNPLSALQLSVALLAPEQGMPTEERIRETAARLLRQIARMNRMLGDFLDVAKIEAGQLDVRPAIHDLRGVVQEVVDLFRDAASEHPIYVRLPERGVFVNCDALRIEQVITNLLSNAIKYSTAGTDVRVELESSNGQAVLSVTDRGAGISDADRTRIFEPFRRGGLSKGTVPGVGLGLFAVRKIVDAHQGRIEVESRSGVGSTFRVILPGVDPLERSRMHERRDLAAARPS